VKVIKALPVLAAVVSGLAGIAIAAGPAQAGDTGRVHGCAAHWRNTATWNECRDSPAVRVNLNVDCNWEPDHSGDFKKVAGTVDPVDQFQCKEKANSAWVGFQ
jgi:hypothetical protein